MGWPQVGDLPVYSPCNTLQKGSWNHDKMAILEILGAWLRLIYRPRNAPGQCFLPMMLRKMDYEGQTLTSTIATTSSRVLRWGSSSGALMIQNAFS